MSIWKVLNHWIWGLHWTASPSQREKRYCHLLSDPIHLCQQRQNISRCIRANLILACLTKTKPELLKAPEDRQDVLCRDHKQGNLSSPSHCALLWLFKRWLQTDWSSLTSCCLLSAALCFALTGETMYSRGWSFMMFIFFVNWTVSCQLPIVFMYVKSYWNYGPLKDL